MNRVGLFLASKVFGPLSISINIEGKIALVTLLVKLEFTFCVARITTVDRNIRTITLIYAEYDTLIILRHGATKVTFPSTNELW